MARANVVVNRLRICEHYSSEIAIGTSRFP
jgi:hypothetical protein